MPRASVKFYERDGIEWFFYEGPVTTPSVGLVVDCKASEQHKKDYPIEYKDFLQSKVAAAEVKQVMIEAVAPKELNGHDQEFNN